MALARGVSASQAQDYYYEKDPITASEGKGENSEWYGNLKDTLGLGSHIHAEEFAALLAGQHPETNALLVKAGVNKERRAGIDLAFSAPKSVSIMALHVGDERIVEAHKEAVKFALDFVQDNFIYYREQTKDGSLIPIQADNMIAGTFTHTTSRANDPQLHTHAVVLNITKARDGKFKAISNEKIYRYQTLTNNIYQNQLANNLQKLGYFIDNRENKFEIKGVSDEAIETFSKRSREIEALYEKLRKKYPDKSEAELMDQAVLQSRNEKDKVITAEELRDRWESEFSKDKITPVLEYEKPLMPEKNIVKDAVDALHETEATFNAFKLLNSILVQNMGKKSLDEHMATVHKATIDGTLTKLGAKSGEVIYSTPEMIKTECDIVSAVKKAIGAEKPLLKSNKILRYLPNNLTDGQREFVEHALTSKDRINIIQGDAGTGKTYAVKTLNDIIQKEKLNKNIIGLGFTGKAAQELAEAAKITTSTIASFLMSPKELKNALIIVDESSMVSSRDMLSLINKAGDNRIVFVGDCKQLQAIGAGKMFKELQNANLIKTVRMEEVLRQQTEITRNIVRHIKNYQDGEDENGIDIALNVLEDNKLITEPKSKSNRYEINKLFLYENAVEEYAKSKGALLLTPSREEKDELNSLVRRRILTEQQLLDSQTATTRESVYASGFIAGAYKINDVIMMDMKEGRIKSINTDMNTIDAVFFNKKTQTEETVTIDPAKTEFIAYRERQQNFCKGDKILFTKNDKNLKVQNGLSGVIKSIDAKGNVTADVGRKTDVTFNLSSYSYIDHGYAQTIHKSQGQTADKAILVHNGKSSLPTESFYVAATRAKYEFKVVTLDKEELSSTIKRGQNKSSTREFVGDRQDI